MKNDLNSQPQETTTLIQNNKIFDNKEKYQDFESEQISQSSQQTKSTIIEDQQQNIIQEDESQINELLFGGGGGCISFFEGFSQALLEIVGRDKLKKFKFGGVSCGAAVAGYFYISVHSNYDMKYFYTQHTRHHFIKENMKLFGFVMGTDLLIKDCIECYKLAEDLKLPNVNDNHYLVISVKKGLFSYEKMLVDNFQGPEDYAQALLASTTVPILIGLRLSVNFRGMQAVDGGLTGPIPYKYKKSKKIFLNVLPKISRQWPLARDIPDNCEYIDVGEMCDLKFPMDYYLWNEEWMDEMFYKGYLVGLDNRDYILSIFNKY